MGTRRMATRGPRLTIERTADGERARAEYIEDLTNAWKEDPKFGNALNLAVVIGQSASLKEYLVDQV